MLLHGVGCAERGGGSLDGVKIAGKTDGLLQADAGLTKPIGNGGAVVELSGEEHLPQQCKRILLAAFQQGEGDDQIRLALHILSPLCKHLRADAEPAQLALNLTQQLQGAIVLGGQIAQHLPQQGQQLQRLQGQIVHSEIEIQIGDAIGVDVLIEQRRPVQLLCAAAETGRLLRNIGEGKCGERGDLLRRVRLCLSGTKGIEFRLYRLNLLRCPARLDPGQLRLLRLAPLLAEGGGGEEAHLCLMGIVQKDRAEQGFKPALVDLLPEGAEQLVAQQRLGGVAAVEPAVQRFHGVDQPPGHGAEVLLPGGELHLIQNGVKPIVVKAAFRKPGQHLGDRVPDRVFVLFGGIAHQKHDVGLLDALAHVEQYHILCKPPLQERFFQGCFVRGAEQLTQSAAGRRPLPLGKAAHHPARSQQHLVCGILRRADLIGRGKLGRGDGSLHGNVGVH